MTAAQIEGVNANAIPGEAFRVSECHFAEAEPVHTKTHEELDEWGVHFLCKECGETCLIETSMRVVELRRELAELKALKEQS